MGTRNLVVITLDSKMVVAQYGQYDGYPQWSGVEILRFFRRVNMDNFRAKLGRCKFVSDEEFYATPKPSTDYRGVGVLNYIDSYRWDGEYYSNDTSTPIELVDSYDFAGDSLFCEYAYVIDILEDNSVRLGVYDTLGQVDVKDGDYFFRVTKEFRERNEGDVDFGLIRRASFTWANADSIPTDSDFLAKAVYTQVEAE